MRGEIIKIKIKTGRSYKVTKITKMDDDDSTGPWGKLTEKNPKMFSRMLRGEG